MPDILDVYRNFAWHVQTTTKGRPKIPRPVVPRLACVELRKGGQRSCHCSGLACMMMHACKRMMNARPKAAQQSNLIAEKAQWSIGANDGRGRNARHRAERHRTGT